MHGSLSHNTQGFVVDARLHHFAAGYDMAQRIAGGEFGGE